MLYDNNCWINIRGLCVLIKHNTIDCVVISRQQSTVDNIMACRRQSVTAAVAGFTALLSSATSPVTSCATAYRNKLLQKQTEANLSGSFSFLSSDLHEKETAVISIKE